MSSFKIRTIAIAIAINTLFSTHYHSTVITCNQYNHYCRHYHPLLPPSLRLSTILPFVNIYYYYYFVTDTIIVYHTTTVVVAARPATTSTFSLGRNRNVYLTISMIAKATSSLIICLSNFYTKWIIKKCK